MSGGEASGGSGAGARGRGEDSNVAKAAQSGSELALEQCCGMLSQVSKNALFGTGLGNKLAATAAEQAHTPAAADGDSSGTGTGEAAMESERA